MAKHSVYYAQAVKNRRLTNDLYKVIISKNRSQLGQISIKDFKKAFHSKYTSVDLRAYLLYSLFQDTTSLKSDMIQLQDKNRPIHTRTFKIISAKGNKPRFYFQNLVYNDRLNEVRLAEYRLTTNQKMQIRGWEPKMKNKGKALLNILNSDNVHAQKAYFLLSNSTIAIVAMADIVAKNIRFNDPMRLWYDLSDEVHSKQSIIDRSFSYHSVRDHQEVYKSHIVHMKQEFNKYFPKLQKLGIDTRRATDLLDRVEGLVTRFISNGEMFDTSDTFEGSNELASSLYEIHDASRDALDELIVLADKIENFDINSASIYELKRLEVVESYVDYSPRKQRYREQILDKNAMNILKGMRSRLNRMDVDVLAELDSISGKEFFNDS